MIVAGRSDVLARVVSLIEHQSDPLAASRQLAQSLGQPIDYMGKLGAVMHIAWIWLVQDRHMEVAAHQQSKAYLPQAGSLLLVSASYNKSHET